MWAKDEMRSLEGYLGYIPAYDVPYGGTAAAAEPVKTEVKNRVNLWSAVELAIFRTLKPFPEIYKTMQAALLQVCTDYGLPVGVRA